MHRDSGGPAPRLRIVVAATILVAGCASSASPKIDDMPKYYAFAHRRGETPTCKLEGRPLVAFPGMGGDTVAVRPGKPVIVADVGDSATGPTADMHDRIVIDGARPEQFEVAREGAALKLCSAERNMSVVIMRQYCEGTDDKGRWNNAVEEITFSSGETWLSDEIVDALDPDERYVTQTALESYGVRGVAQSELERWRVVRMSDAIPQRGSASRACAAAARRHFAASE